MAENLKMDDDWQSAMSLSHALWNMYEHQVSNCTIHTLSIHCEDQLITCLSHVYN